MGSINVIPDKKVKAMRAVKLAAQIASYIFEEECGELKYANQSNINALKSAQKALGKIAKNSMK